MTILALDSAVVSSELTKMISANGPISHQSLSQGWSIPRINLRKRPCASSKMTNLESVNSAFLSGLFADVAMATQVSFPEDTAVPTTKKSRINKTKSMPRCDRSFAVLMKALNQASEDPHGESCSNSNTAPAVDATDLCVHRDNSLQFQLDCVAPESTDVSSATTIAFPHLPATISDSSYSSNKDPSSPTSTLTHVISDLQSSITEKITTNETYGWFVEMEDESSTTTSKAPTIDLYFPPKDLAFSAHVAPKADNYDAELEWATAADTVDDVLGCFF